MRRLTLLKILLLSLVSSCCLCVCAFLALRGFEDFSGSSHRQELALRIAREFETEAWSSAFQKYSEHHGPGAGRMQIWAVDATGQLLGSTTSEPLPFEWNEQCRPGGVHEIAVRYSFLSFVPEFTCIRLDRPDLSYLILHFVARRSNRVIWGTSFAFIFATVALAFFLSLTMSFFYLQRKSREAKKVLSRLEVGDLDARFSIKQFDEIGSLMLDFNRMADKLREVIQRLHQVENTRTDLLHQLGHDLRTPLTSLRTSLETLRQDAVQLSEGDRNEFMNLMEMELKYVVRLFDDLSFIADLREPRFQADAEVVDLASVLQTEVRIRSANSRLQWTFVWNEGDSFRLQGDPYLFLRVFKNAFDNAARFAKSSVKVELQSIGDTYQIRVDDDGPGLSLEAAEQFGNRRKNRTQTAGYAGHLSLGLGSVIMRTIAEIYRGTAQIENRIQDGQITGARQTLVFKKF